MKKTLYIKFIVTYLIFGFLCFITVATLTSDMTLNYLVKDKAAVLYEESTLISRRYASNFYKSNVSIDDITAQLESIDTYISAPIWIVDADGNIQFNSRETVTEDAPQVIEHFDPADTGNAYYMIGDFYGKFDSEMLSVFSPIVSNFRVRGYVVIHSPMQDLRHTRDKLLNISYISLCIIFILSLLILVVFTDMVYIPIRKITTATEEYAAGHLKYEFTVDKEDEIGYLANTLAYMATKLSRSEENQKKFIANVSHDFRSPLTSIKGFLEAMIDGTIPPEMHEKYLNIVLNETERLNKLTSSLLTLNNLDTHGIMLDITDFDVNAVIKNTAATFEGTCRPKKITIELILTGKTLFVEGDVGKIQQVLYNLIDNAIKFSENNSSVTIETSQKNDKVFISVKDQGIGIPKDSLKLIWDRFYKTDLSRGKDKKGTGLGLSIVREIIKAHNENINVISTEGVGTEFIFTLPRSKADGDE